MSIFITGIDGFVGSHLTEYLLSLSEGIFGLVLKGSVTTNIDSFENRINLIEGDLKDLDGITDIIGSIKPDIIIHLAGQSIGSFAVSSPQSTFQTNVMGGVNLLEAVRQTNPKTRVLISLSAKIHEGLCSGGLCQGKTDNTLIINEETPLFPSDPLSASQAALDMIAGQYNKSYSMNIVITRTMNLVGPRQNQHYVLSDIASQMARFITGYSDSNIITGDTSASRDFLDVRDAVRLYHQIAVSGTSSIYTIASGVPRRISDLIKTMSEFSGENSFTFEEDPIRVVRYGNGVRYGSVDKIKAEFNFTPKIPLEKSIGDLLNYWINRLDRQEH